MKVIGTIVRTTILIIWTLGAATIAQAQTPSLRDIAPGTTLSAIYTVA